MRPDDASRTAPVGDQEPLPASKPDTGEPEEGNNQDVAVERIYPDDPTGADPA
ncbi:hypothetical protein [Cellulomonas sp. URHE0023]|uniref:hypothetical protein n=1 Tax=Cellulomonas sp. URHE0023 TaxID=1380354 RepID=UPI000B27D3D8|nr:hypothetical protein [Cellulomonas sp. URHE0023]